MFNGNVAQIQKLLRDNFQWFLNNYKADYTPDQCDKMLHMTKMNLDVILDMNSHAMKAKFDHSLQRFIAEFHAKYPNLKLKSEYSEMLFNKWD